MDHKKTVEFIEPLWNSEVVPKIEEYVRVPNQSPGFDAEWASNGLQEKAMGILVDWVKSRNVPNLKMELIEEKGRTPLLFMSLEGTEDCKSQASALLYGHMDKQPPMTEHWTKPYAPYDPIIVDGKLYGRGGADDGYACFAAITAIENLLKQGLSHTKLVVLIEASEESASPDLPYYVKKLTDEGKLGPVELIVCLDSGCGNYDQFWLTTSLRGLISGVLTVEILKEATHSGSASGIVPDSFRILRNVLDRIEDSNTGKVLVDELYTKISEARIQQAKDAATFLGNEIYEEFPFVEGAKPTLDDLTELLLNKTWKPQLTCTGAGGFPTIPTAGNVLRTKTSIKLSTRLPPGVDNVPANKVLKKILEANPPYNAKVTYEIEDGGNGWASPELADWLDKSLQKASQAYFGKPCALVGEGGSIPFMGMLGEQFPKAQFVVTGVLGPLSNAHGPNEFLDIQMAKNVTCSVSSILFDFCSFCNN